jgi:integrase/recombinase XerD
MEAIMKKPTVVCVTGPLGPHGSGYRIELARLGYSPWTASAHLYLMADVSGWMLWRDVQPAAFDSTAIQEFLADRRASGKARRLTPRGLIPLLGYLRGLGVVPAPAEPAQDGPMDWLVAEFAGYLISERGLSPQTVAGYRRVAARFLAAGCAQQQVRGLPGEGLGGLDGRQIKEFVLADNARLSVGSANNVVTALRSLMGFLYLQGHTPTSLADAVPRAAAWRDTGRSRALPPAEVTRLLASCERATAAGLRDFAIVTMLTRLGLRAGEVASLRVDDVDWRAGEITVAGKGNRHDRLPLPVDVGQALAEYCRDGRASRGDRHLFVQVRAPYGGLSATAVSHVVVRACRRAGLAPCGAHRLRHSSATAMRRAGAPLFEIGQVLRHRHTVTTAGYAKDDLDALMTIAQAWPGAQG